MPLSQEQRESIKKAFSEGTLKVQSVDPDTCEVKMRPVSDIHQHASSDKNLIEVVCSEGQKAVFTLDHSVFVREGVGIRPVKAGALKTGSRIVTVKNGKVEESVVSKFKYLSPHEYTYDLSVPGTQNFVLSNGILAHNSYSIGGISLSLDRSSNYQSLKQNAEGQFEKMIEIKSRTTWIHRGLQQPRFGVGIRSSFGPSLGSGILSPRSFV